MRIFLQCSKFFSFFLKKRKASNADQSIGSNNLSSVARSALVEESALQLDKTNNGRCPGPTSGDEAVDSSIAAKKVPAVAKQPPAPLTFYSGCSSLATQPEETVPAVKEEKDSEQPESVGTKSKEGSVQVSSRAGGGVVENDKAEKAGATPRESNSTDQDPRDSSDDHLWETVAAKARGSRGRRACSGQGGSGRPSAQGTPSVTTGAGSASKKVKKARDSRRRAASRKVAKDIISSVLDGVDADVKRRRMQAAKSVGVAKRPDRLSQAINGSLQGSAWQLRPMTMRDVVLGRLRAEAEIQPKVETGPIDNCDAGPSGKKSVNADGKARASAWVADQCTAPTVPETVSGISAGNTQSSGISVGDNGSVSCITTTEKAAERTLPGDCSSGGMAVHASAQHHTKVDNKETSPTPPLKTLLGPNDNSASSSVASSLEVPHGRHLHHHHSSVSNENDVGYHLLDVCDRLSRDMDVFMGRRAVALGIRRRERGALLAALQDTASVSISAYDIPLAFCCTLCG